MATSEYIRDDRFEAISCSVKVDGNATFCHVGEDAIEAAFAKIDWDDATVLAHQAHFDGLILTHRFKRVPRRWACTLSMGRAIHPKSERNRLEDVAVRYG